jgi:hypothetical protein
MVYGRNWQGISERNIILISADDLRWNYADKYKAQHLVAFTASGVRNRKSSSVGNDRFVFNIRRNTYRLIAMIFFEVRTVYIRFIGLHKVYDKVDASGI